MKKTLYVTDLDDTLLRSDKTLSSYAENNINRLCREGMLFSYATARSYLTASKVTVGIGENIPVIVYNGAFIIENGTKKQLLKNSFTAEESRSLLDRIISANVYPRVFSYINGEERFTYTPEHLGPLAVEDYLESRRGDPRARLGTVAELYEGDIFIVSCIDTYERLLPLFRELSGEFVCHFYEDNKRGDQWLEILPREATKANAVLALKKMLGCERLVVFGDGVNDISMFEAADECYAVANALPQVKERATAVIGSNDSDGVVKFLLREWERHK